MREIKFRYWIKDECKMMFGFEFLNADPENGVLQFGDQGFYVDQFRYQEMEKRERAERGEALKSDYETMQFTGLKDKNGKEIYEGDILRIKHLIGDESDIELHGWYCDVYYRVRILELEGLELYAIKMVSDDTKNQNPIHVTLSPVNKSLGVDYINNNLDRLAVLDTWGTHHASDRRWRQNHYSNDIEIAGNIYENPELLK